MRCAGAAFRGSSAALDPCLGGASSSSSGGRGNPLRTVALTLFVAAAVGSLSIEAVAAPSSIRLVRVTSPVANGEHATLVARVRPRRVCSIAVYYSSRPSKAAGLNPKRPVLGRVRWTWKVGTRTRAGRHRIVVICGSAGRLLTSFVTTR
jgi:hypothetical protein